MLVSRFGVKVEVMKSLLYGSLLLLGALAAPAAEPVAVLVDAAQSHVDFDVKATIGSFTGHLAHYEAGILIDPATGAVKAAHLGFKFADVKTGEDKRDGHMSAWQETDKFPDAAFDLISLQAVGAAGYQARGKLTFHGQTQEITFPVSLLTEGNAVSIDGTAQLDTQRWGLPLIRKFLALRVDPLVTVRFHLQGALAQHS